MARCTELHGAHLLMLLAVLVAVGNALPTPASAAMEPTAPRFVKVAAAAGVSHVYTSDWEYFVGGGVATFDRDGRLDLVVVNRGSPVEIFHNQGQTTGNWLQLRLEQSGPNRNGIGAWIEVSDGARSWSREVTIGGGHASGANGWIHFGLGAAEAVRIAVHWPDGHSAQLKNVQPNTFLTLTR